MPTPSSAPWRPADHASPVTLIISPGKAITRFHGGFGGVFIVEREVPVIVEREVVREAAGSLRGTDTDVPIALPRKPYVIGSTYASLPPQGCMKLIEDGASYYFCSGEWYRQLGAGRGAKYRAVARP